MSFQGPIYTDVGKALHNRLIGTGTLKFTKMQMGDGSLGGTTIAALTALINPLVTMEVQRLKQYSDYIVVTAPFTNATITTAFNWREIGLFAADPDYPDDRTKDILFCYQNAYSSAAPIPPGSQEFIERLVNIPIKLSDVSDVTITISASLIYALKDPLTGKIYPDDIPLDYITSTQAATYSNTQSYAVGDYCTKDGQMYKCNTPITAGEEWTADHWTATSMGAEFKAVNAALAGKAAANHIHTAEQVGADPSGAAAVVQTSLNTHTGRTDNPHSVTAAQVGADQSGAAAAVQTNLTAHAGRTDNPHGVTRAQIGAAATTTLTCTVPVSWTASGDYFWQNISVPGLLAADNPVADILTGSDNAANKLYAEAWGKVLRAITYDGLVQIWCTEAPTVAFPVQFKVVR